MRKFTSLTLLLALLSGCVPEKTPSQVYEEYNSRVIDGLSFSDEKAYFSKRTIDEIESKFPQYMKSMRKSRDEVIEFYSKFSREQAKCKRIDLMSEVIDGNLARLEYSQQDICGGQEGGKEKQLIRMVKEGGWKIDDIEIKL